jgi:hypothetical protein
MLHLRDLGLLARRADRQPANRWARRARLVGNLRTPRRLRELLIERDGVDPDDVIMSRRRRARAA